MSLFRVLRPFDSFGPDMVGRIVELPADLRSLMLMKIGHLEPVDILEPVLPEPEAKVLLEDPKGTVRRGRPRKDKEDRGASVRPATGDEVHRGDADADAGISAPDSSETAA